MDTIQTIATVAAAMATCFAAIVALKPIFEARRARDAKAFNIRMRLSVKLHILKQKFSIMSDERRNKSLPDHLAKDLKVLLSQFETLLAQSECLYPKEQDRVSQVVANLELMVPMIENDYNFSLGTLDNLILMIDKATEELAENGILSSDPDQPWREDGRS